MIKISIIIPTFNRENLIKECLNSILIQTNPNWEAVVVDDGSTDATWEILQSYAQQDERIKVFKRVGEPKGANRCRNQGVEHCTGDYVLFLDSDDLIGETCIESRNNYINKHPKLDFIVFPEVGFIKNPKTDAFPIKHLFRNESDIKGYFRNRIPWLTTGPLIKTEFFNRFEFNELLQKGQDWELYVRFLLSNPSYIRVEDDFESDVFKRLDDKVVTISNSQSISIFENKRIALTCILEEFGDYICEHYKDDFIFYFEGHEFWNLSKEMPFLQLLLDYKIINTKEFFALKTKIRFRQAILLLKRTLKKSIKSVLFV